MPRLAIAFALVAGALVSACGGSNAPSPALAVSSSSSSSGSMSMNASCTPSGTSLQISAKDTKFSTDCLAAPAGQAFTIHFDNMDPLAHNVAVYSADPMEDKNAKTLFKGDLVTGPKMTDYSVSALTAGTYHFHCDVHPTQMYGAFVVK
jgi:plastocyanin